MNDYPTKQSKPVYIQDISPYRDDEISLIDLSLILIKRKTLFISILLSFIVAGIAIALIVPKKYMYSTSIEIGSQLIDNKVQPLESPNTLRAKLQHGYIPIVQKSWLKGAPEDSRKFKIHAIIPQSSQIIVLEAKAAESDDDTIVNLLSQITSKATADSNKIYTSLQLSLQQLKRQTEQKIQALAKKADASSEIETLQQTLDNYDLQLANLRKTRIILPPTPSEEPVSISRKLIVIAATLLGLFSGFVTVFVAEFISKVKEVQLKRTT